MSVHRERLAASTAHRRFVEGVRAALQKLAPNAPSTSDISPVMIGAKPLSFAAPPMMEAAFGYRGTFRFVAFGYSPRTREFMYCDGGDDIRGDSEPWLRFLHHPLVAVRVPKSRYPTLYGVLKWKAQSPLQRAALGGIKLGQSSEQLHCLLLDRETRRLYVCRRDQAILFFSLTEPDDKDTPRVFVNGLRMSPPDCSA